MKLRSIYIIVSLASLALSAEAITIASWNTQGQPGSQTVTSGAGSANVTAVSMARGGGLSAVAAADSMNSRGWGGSDADDFFEFGFTVAAGFEATLKDLIIGTRSSNTGPGTIGVYTNLDGFAAPVATIVQPGGTQENSIIDLSSLAPVTGLFSVRLIEVGDTQADGVGATSNSGTFRVADFFDGSSHTDSQFTGTVSASAPSLPDQGSSLVLLALGVIPVVLRKKIRRA